MATRKIVPRADGEGSIGKATKQWGAVHTKDLILNKTGDTGQVLAKAEDGSVEFIDSVVVSPFNLQLVLGARRS